ncbi:MAG: hypothetical protein KJ597_02235, partial [Nanoarchaeota archaeon]|nr:hypothetical protein [Nanoarchaeota archaeon]
MTITRKDEQKFVEEVSKYLIANLSGAHVKDSVRIYKPSREYIIGCLSASFQGKTHQRTIANTNSLAISFLVDEFKPFTLDLDCNVFYRQTIAEDDPDKVPIWKKLDVSFKDLQITKPEDELTLDFQS